MVPTRDRRDEEQTIGGPHSLAYQAESYRSALESSQANGKFKGEERVSVFWRVFGGTLLSIGALIAITLYQQFGNSLAEIRTNLNRLTESRGDFVKIDDCNTRFTAIWNTVKELQAANAALLAMKERSALLEQQFKASEEEQKGLVRDLQQLRERQATLEGRQAVAPHVTGATPPRSK